jgi:putative tryptophan/tyrosine transport system substrate-binding protein
VVAVLSAASAEDYRQGLVAFRDGLCEGGYVDGQNARIEYVFADDRYDRLPELARDLARRQVNVIFAVATPAALALKSTGTTIPIVFGISGDPVGTGLVASLGRPMGNITGAAHMNVEVAPKRLELLHELLPSEKLIGLLLNPTNPVSPSVSAAVSDAARALHVEVRVIEVRNDQELDRAFADFGAMKIGGLVIGSDPFFTSRAGKIGALALTAKMPAIYQYRDFVEGGGLMSYGGDNAVSYRRAGVYVGRILKGEKPENLPVQLSTKVELFLNLKSARQLGVAVPLSLSGRADEVIE